MVAYLAATTEQDLPALAAAAGAERFEFAADPTSEDGSSGWLVFPDLEPAALDEQLRAASVAQARAVAQTRLDLLTEQLEGAEAGLEWVRAIATEVNGRVAPAQDFLVAAMQALNESGIDPRRQDEAELAVMLRTKDLQIRTDEAGRSTAAIDAFEASDVAPLRELVAAAQADLDAIS